MMVESAGLKNVDLFFLNPEENPMPEEEPAQPTEFEKVSMAQIEGENKRKVAELELKYKEQQLKHKKIMLDFETKIQELELQYNKNIDQEEIKRQTKLSVEAMRQIGGFAKGNMPQPNIPPNDPMIVPMPPQGIQPPVAPAEYTLPRPTINLSTKFGVPLLPLQRAQFDGTSPSVPDHIIIPPIGMIPLPTKSPAVTVPVTFASSVDVSCSACTMPVAVTLTAETSAVAVTFAVAIRLAPCTSPDAVILSPAIISSVE